MSPTTGWILLGTCTLLVLLPSIALMGGWIPSVIRHRPGPVRLLGAGGAALYGAALCAFLPRVAHADRDIVTAGEYGAVLMCAVTVALAVAYDVILGPSWTPDGAERNGVRCASDR
ncbi:hypothetical protein [Streptomyces indicus]|uniref:Uncharacterized protein n=1 Tax=Streptomyces indicus TaxID=417292 RepID=A0A1G9GPQ0_9ACTN|nr:hypothetical protein [Streptomyces indicus]SDL02659.1 hypothetical protein SAMN05421806_116133 [Streptomyces indicus]